MTADLPRFTSPPEPHSKTALQLYITSRKGVVKTLNDAGKFDVGLLTRTCAAEWREMNDTKKAPFIAAVKAMKEALAGSETVDETAVAVQYVLFRLPQPRINRIAVAPKRYRNGSTSVSMLYTDR